MKIAIHHRKGSFSERWIEYCKINSVDYKVVNAYSNEIIRDIKECDGFMWHWHHTNYKDHIVAKQLVQSLEATGIRSFPNVNTSWHFDDKIGQKYLFESMGLPNINSYIFYDEKLALDWANRTEYPKVFKLKGGAGSSNVVLLKDKSSAIKKIKIAFNKGFNLVEDSLYFKKKWDEFKDKKNFNNFLKLNKGIYKMIIKNRENHLLPVQKGYVYFQDFVKNNTYDTRVVTIGKRSLAVRRMNRKNDFRASGSGIVDPSPDKIDLKAVKLSIDIARKLDIQSLACDFIYDEGELKIVEISYGIKAGLPCSGFMGYWDESLKWNDGEVNPEFWIIEDFISSIDKN